MPSGSDGFPHCLAGYYKRRLLINNALLILAYVTIFAVVAGYVTAVTAERAKVGYALALGVLMLLFGGLSGVSAFGGERELQFPKTDTTGADRPVYSNRIRRRLPMAVVVGSQTFSSTLF